MEDIGFNDITNNASSLEKPKKKKNKKKKIIIILIVLFLIVGAGVFSYFFFFKKDDVKKKKPNNKKEEVVVKKLTIVDEDSNKRPIAIMIDNNVGNNSHAGLSEAYITYECIVEGGLTRIMAVFKDKDTTLIGPIRSSRHYFLDYALESDAIYAHFGWSPYAENDIKSLGVNNINGLYDSAPYWRDKTIAAPHNVFTSIEKLYQTATDKNYATTTDDWKLLNYTTDEVNLNAPIGKKKQVNAETGKTEEVDETNPELITANNIVIDYSNSQTRSYTYDANSKRYLRYMNNVPHTDKTTNETLSYKNLIIISVANHSLDSYGRQDLTTTGTGTGYYITNGYALPITWSKDSRTAKTKYTYSDGKEIKINDGNTFIQVEPSTFKPDFS